MEWIIGQGSNEVDIGYVPLMKLFSSSSVLWEPTLDLPSEDVFDYSNMTWDEEIALSTSTQEIERFFYPFKKVRSTIKILKASKLTLRWWLCSGPKCLGLDTYVTLTLIKPELYVHTMTAIP